MQELVVGMERLRVDLEADVEQQRGAQPLPFLGECSIKDCPFLHVDTTVDNSRACPWYDRGFCRNGPSCKYKHRRRVMCANYLVGFCPEGPNCKFMQ
ncbi:cleavage and polyadenylation specificity factor subunit 4-like [Aythya fuligula]|uniref:Cleavage and polyadenylation specificity factor subunit 4 n=1 Tax=Aythya fuligula TaxID=219594 RepID=A0A6J3E2V0_AYTFU|nr:cleavage and polyadenylation specificity factor subunit 4-like [Aythya fuligula]